SRAAFRLVYSVRDPDQVMYAEELDERAAENELLLDLLYTRTAPEGERRTPGRITATDLAIPENTGWRSGAAPRAYVCGPTGFVEHAIGLLLTLGYTNKTIRAERFGPTGA
ncbi:MAG: oxidoreductase, partial [Marmoricola sp.]